MGQGNTAIQDDRKSPLNVLNNFDGARNIKGVYADYDAGYLYLRIDIIGSRTEQVA